MNHSRLTYRPTETRRVVIALAASFWAEAGRPDTLCTGFVGISKISRTLRAEAYRVSGFRDWDGYDKLIFDADDRPTN